MELTWIEDVEALAESGNFSRAATLRNVTQPAFSRRIRALEDWAGTPLFERGEQPVRLTEAGLRLRPLLRDVLRCVEDVRDEARSIAGTGGTLRFAATHALSFSFFPAWLRNLPNRPPATIQLVSDGLGACERLMSSGQAEFLLCHCHPAAPPRLPESEFASRAVGQDRLLLVRAPDGRMRPGLQAAPPVLAYGSGSGLGRIIAATGWTPPAPPAFTSHLAAALHSMVRDGHGIAWLPESLILDDLEAGTLVPASIDVGPVAVEIRMFRPVSIRNRLARAFWDGIADDGPQTP